ncbi:hypothetical protein HPT25_26245 [Bacillus sp. BRMEA1]|uniref:hypothetical protein n=1 Tax=Neobacillus endophyticus TaxID=2738405 RepID=UPI001565A431|nr:hypothetical protein [Neobacillus endophyticus]NRD80832.1 hypothetical protein [Neobacillus endophyticus]
MSHVLLAIGDSGFSQILRNRLNEHDFDVLENEVLHRDYLEEFVKTERPDILIVHDYYLASSKESKEDREKELLTFFQKIRIHHDDEIRVVFLCEREKDDPFLAELVSRNVLDIFHNKSISIQELVEQLKDRPRFSRVSKFLSGHSAPHPSSTGITQLTPTEELFEIGNLEEEEEPEETTTEKSPKAVKEKVVVQKVVNKQVVQKVVNKQVVKRDYHFQILNQVERVVGVPIEKKLVLIGSPFARCGSTFVSHLLAKELTNMGVSVTYIESPYSQPYSYDRFIGHEVIPDYRSKFHYFSTELSSKTPTVYDWSFHDINFIVKNPSHEPVYNVKDLPFDVYVKVLLASQSTVTIIDIGTGWNQEIYQDIYDIASNAYFIIEPDICNIQYLADPDNHLTSFVRTALNDKKTSLIGNRFDPAIMKYDVIQDLYAEKIKTLIPEFPSKDVFESQYKGTFLNDMNQHQKQIYEALAPIVEDLLPKEFIKQQGKQTGFFKGLFNKKITVEKSEKRKVNLNEAGR